VSVPQEDPPVPPVTHQAASGTSGFVVQIGGNLNGTVTFWQRPKLSTSPVPSRDRTDAAEPVWAPTPTPERAVESLHRDGIAVIAGENGTGRRISAIHALQTYFAARTDGSPPELIDVAADWADDEVPDKEILPDPVPDCGYLIDATARTLSEDAIIRLTSWADKLHSVRSCVIITTNKEGWQGDSRYLTPAERPNPTQVACNHLAERLKRPEHARWLRADSDLDRTAAYNWGLRKKSDSHPDPTAGIFANLITDSVSPSHAVDIAERLSGITPGRVAEAVAQKKIEEIQDEVLLWQDFLEGVLTRPGTRGQDRVMLLSAAYLEGAPVELCIKAAAKFGAYDEQGDAGDRDDRRTRRYREGRSPRRRLRDVGVDTTPDDKVAFERHPRLAGPAIRMDWKEWADEREATKKWIQDITAPKKGVAAEWAEKIGERLLEMSREVVDPPFFAILDHWIAVADIDAQRVLVIAKLLTKASQKGELAWETNQKLLAWAQSGKTYQRQAAAQVCAGSYGLLRPNMALVRLRHIFGSDDAATEIAAKALVSHAAHGESGLRLIVETISRWLDKYPDHPGGPRAFLALVDPSRDHQLLGRLFDSAQRFSKIRDFLIDGWQTALQLTDVHEQAYRVLLGWAQAVHEGRLDREFTFGILTEVRNEHTPLDAMSRFLYGNRDEDPALVNARLELANIPSLPECSHAQCSHTGCPVKLPAGATTRNNSSASENGLPQGDSSDPPSESSDQGDSAQPGG